MIPIVSTESLDAHNRQETASGGERAALKQESGRYRSALAAVGLNCEAIVSRTVGRPKKRCRHSVARNPSPFTNLLRLD